MELILDLDSLLYKAGSSVEKNIRHVRQGGVEIANFNYAKDLKIFLKEREDVEELEIEVEHWVDTEQSALKLFDLLVHGIKELRHDRFVMYLGGTNNFRYDIAPDYKANRDGMPKPVHLQALTDYAIRKGAIVPDGYEADDSVAIRAWEHLNAGTNFVIAGIDKDLRQIPGWHYNYGKGNPPFEIDPTTAEFNFYVQLLMGDSSDNIPGIKGVGIKTAEKLLATCNDERDMYKVCVDKWTELTSWGDDTISEMRKSAALLYLLRSPDDKWEPPI